jgi:hypothetical protein
MSEEKQKQKQQTSKPVSGKGSRPRSGYNEKYREEWERIFRKTKTDNKLIN